MTSQMLNRGPPYLPTTWSLGGTPTKRVDIPITAIFLVLYIVSAIWHMTIFQLNNRRGHKFIFNALLFGAWLRSTPVLLFGRSSLQNVYVIGFSMARITTCVLRIASISLPTDIQLGIAASIFVAAGVLLIFIINLLWAQRLLRAFHPTIGWHRATSIVFTSLYVIIGLTLAVVITSVVQNFYTLRPRTKFIDRALQLYGQTLFAVISSLPIIIVLLVLATSRRCQPEKFGAGRLSYKIAVLLTGSALVSLGAWYRCGTSWKTPVPRSEPLPAYFSKACFYVFNFVVEILTVYLYAIMRVDLRFHVPDGANGPGSYERRPDIKSTREVVPGDEEAGEAKLEESYTIV